MKILPRILILSLAWYFVSACGASDDDKKPDLVDIGGNISIPAGSSPLFIQFSSTTKSSDSSGLNLASPEATNFRNSAIASGPAEEFHFYIKEMNLVPAEDGINIPIFKDDSGNGKKIIIKKNSTVDLSDLFTQIACLDDEGDIVELEADQVCECGLDENGKLIEKVTVDQQGNALEKAYCPEIPEGGTPPVGVMAVEQAGEYKALSITVAKIGQYKGCASGIFQADDVARTYCTQKVYDPTKRDSYANEDFEGKIAELMKVDLNPFGNGDETLNFPIKNNFNLAENARPQITLLIDTNRMVRYYNGFSEGSSPIPGDSSKVPLWFPNMLRTSSFAFIGKPGNIQGYSWTAHVTSGLTDDEFNEAPSDYDCSFDCIDVNGWLTVVWDPNGDLLMSSFTPDDDNTLTVIKGANWVSATGLDTSFFESKGANSWDVKYTLGEGFLGKVYNVNFDLDVGSSLETYFNLMNSENGKSYGRIKLTRGF